MVFLITQGDVMKANDVYKMKAHEFLFWAEYLLRKRHIENKKNKNKSNNPRF